MIRDLGGGIPSIHSQTVNLCGHRIPYLKVIEGPVECQSLVGHVLVSRTGDAGWTEREVKVPEYTLIRDHERCESIQTAGRWPWKLESAKECVTTHLPNGLALKMDGAQACYSYLTVNFVLNNWRVGRREGQSSKLRKWFRVERPSVQILVVVANIQVRTLKTEVEKGSMWTVIDHGLVDPKR
jgi:hypothetical protein